MAYKRNPMRAERICSLARFVISLQANGAHTAASQWLERTLDDSANRRLTLPEAFLATDAILVLATNVAAGLEVREAVMRRHVDEQMPFMATERWLMLGVRPGGDRQELHEVIRRHSLAVARGRERRRAQRPAGAARRAIPPSPGARRVAAGRARAPPLHRPVARSRSSEFLASTSRPCSRGPAPLAADAGSAEVRV